MLGRAIFPAKGDLGSGDSSFRPGAASNNKFFGERSAFKGRFWSDTRWFATDVHCAI
jgi:hypothetical protein